MMTIRRNGFSASVFSEIISAVLAGFYRVKNHATPVGE
jgi:hypothetical protein